MRNRYLLLPRWFLAVYRPHEMKHGWTPAV